MRRDAVGGPPPASGRSPGISPPSYRAALALRREHEALVSGSIRFLDAEGDVLAFVRDGGGERLLCAFNFAGDPGSWPLPPDIGAIAKLDGDVAVIEEAALSLPALGYFLGRLD